jgi:hypothetical protein
VTSAGTRWPLAAGQWHHYTATVRNAGTHAWNASGPRIPVLRLTETRRQTSSFHQSTTTDHVGSSPARLQPGEIALFEFSSYAPFSQGNQPTWVDFDGSIWLDGQHLFDIPTRSFFLEDTDPQTCVNGVCEVPR